MKLTKSLKLPDISFHSYTVELPFAQAREPNLNHIWMSIVDCYQSLQSDTFEVFLAFLVHEVRPWHRPSLDSLGEGGRSRCRELEVVCDTHGKISEELEVSDTEGAELK